MSEQIEDINKITKTALKRQHRVYDSHNSINLAEEISSFAFAIQNLQPENYTTENQCDIDSDDWFVASYSALLDDNLAYLGEYFNAEGNWEFPQFSLKKVEHSSEKEIFNWYKNVMGTFQDLADVWGSAGTITMNRHDVSHIEVVFNQLQEIRKRVDFESRFETNLIDNGLSLSQEMKAQTLAVCFHDSGMALAGRENHEQNSIQVLRHVFSDWDDQDPFCQRVEYLIQNHTTAAVNIEKLKNDPGLALVILADESHLEDRLTSLGSTPERYSEDPWIRIAKHIKKTKIIFNQEGMKWELEAHGLEDEMYQKFRFEKGNVVDDISKAIFTVEKIVLFKSIAEALTGKQDSQIEVSINNNTPLTFRPRQRFHQAS